MTPILQQQFDYSPVSTKKLLDSFGWSTSDAYVQHDVQELARLFIDKIESALVARKVNIISQLFKGTYENYTSCLNVDYTSKGREQFYDLQLTVTESVRSSLRQFIKREFLTGENQYFANEKLGLQDAVRGIRFVSFPPVLFIHLKRFEVSALGMSKVNTMCSFTDELDLSEFVIESDERTDVNWNYTLQSVLIHSGNVSGGHYTCMSNVSSNADHKQWVLFDDHKTKIIPANAVFQPNFGGTSTTSAYMLVYVKKDLFSEIMCDVTKDMIKPKVLDKIQGESSCSIL